jgi:hypothetical protein
MLKVIKYFCIFSLLTGGLSACTNTTETQRIAQSNQQKKTEKKQISLIKQVENLEKNMQEWKTVQPNVERLVAIEDELTLLISQLNAIIIEAEEKNKKKGAIHKTKKQVVTTKANNLYAIQFASITDPKMLSKLWDDLYKKHLNLLVNLTPIVEKITVNNRDYYRLKATGFNSKDRVNKVCKQLKKVSVECVISSNSGQLLEKF